MKIRELMEWSEITWGGGVYFFESRIFFLATPLYGAFGAEILVPPFFGGVFFIASIQFWRLQHKFLVPHFLTYSVLKTFDAIPSNILPPYEHSDRSLRIIQPHLWHNYSSKKIAHYWGHESRDFEEHVGLVEASITNAMFHWIVSKI